MRWGLYQGKLRQLYRQVTYSKRNGVSEMKFEPATHGTSLGDNRFTVMPADPPSPLLKTKLLRLRYEESTLYLDSCLRD